MQLTPDRRRIVLNLSSIALERVAQIVLGILINGMLARYLVPADFGRWQYAQTLVIIVLSLTWVCGNEILIPRLVGTDRQTANTVLWHFFVIRLATASLVAAGYVGVVVLFVSDPRLRALLLGLTLLVLLKEPFLVIVAWFQSRTFVQPALLINVAALIIKAGLVAVLIKLHRPLSDFAWVLVVEAVIISASLLVYYTWRKRPRVRLESERLKSYLMLGLKLWVSLLLMYVFARVDRLVLQRLVSFSEYAVYASAAQLNENWLAISGLVTQSLAPILIYGVAEKMRLQRNLRAALAVTGSISVIGGALLYFIAPFLFTQIFGPQYAESAVIFRWLIWLGLFNSLDAVLNLILIKYSRLSWLTFKWLFGVVVTLVTAVILVPRYHASGAAMAAFVGYGMVLICSVLMVRHIFSTLHDPEL